MGRQRRNLFAAVLLALCLAATGWAAAEVDFDVYKYSREELEEIRQLVDARMEELNRLYAVEHADRRVSFEEPEQVVFLGREITLKPTVEIVEEGARANTQFVWSTSDPQVATVSARGVVRAVGRGDAVITAAVADNQYLTAVCTVHAAVPVDQVAVWGETETLLLGGRPEEAATVLSFSVEPEDAYFQDVTWISSDETVATVDENGRVQGLAPGTVTIMAKSSEPPRNGREPKAATLKMTVGQAVTGVRLSEEELTLPVGPVWKLRAAVEPADATDRRIVFRSSKPEIATVDPDGTITPLAPGECVITAEAPAGGQTAACRVTVVRPVESLAVTETQLSMALGTTYTVEAVVGPEDATNRELVWTSSNVFVARVANGTIEATGQGDCEITCATTDGSGLSATIRVRVPSFSIPETEYEVTEKTGLVIPVTLNDPGVQLEITAANGFYTAEAEEGGIRITPVAAGEAEFLAANPEAPEDTVTVKVRIANTAVFNAVSYPAIPYMELARAPELYQGAQVSIYGKILHTSDDGAGGANLMVGTAGENYTDQVMAIHTGPRVLPVNTGAGSMITVYGLFRLDTVYSEVLQTETFVPALDAEKIVADPVE